MTEKHCACAATTRAHSLVLRMRTFWSPLYHLLSWAFTVCVFLVDFFFASSCFFLSFYLSIFLSLFFHSFLLIVRDNPNLRRNLHQPTNTDFPLLLLIFFVHIMGNGTILFTQRKAFEYCITSKVSCKSNKQTAEGLCTR